MLNNRTSPIHLDLIKKVTYNLKLYSVGVVRCVFTVFRVFKYDRASIDQRDFFDLIVSQDI